MPGIRVLLQSRKRYTFHGDAHMAMENAFIHEHNANIGDVIENKDGTYSWFIGIVRD